MTKMTLAFLSLATLSLNAHAQSAGDLMQKIHDNVAAGVQGCGLQILSGQDQRLDYPLRARNVDQVIALVKDSGQVIPGVLVDYSTYATGTNNSLGLQYTRTNGGLIMQINRTFDFNDIAIDTVYAGRVAFTNSYFRGTQVETDYVVQQPGAGARYVGQQEFLNYVDSTVIKGFVDYVCNQVPRP